jgi:hypothetical protein
MPRTIRFHLDEHPVERITESSIMSIRFEIPQDIEQQLRTAGADLDREAKEIYLMEQFRLAKITHRQLEEALALSFHETEDLLKQRGMGQDLDPGELGGRMSRSARDHATAPANLPGSDRGCRRSPGYCESPP